MLRYLTPQSQVGTPNKRQRLREGSSLPVCLPLTAPEVLPGGGGSHFSPESVNAAAVSSSNRPESLGLIRTSNIAPLRNPSVEELEARLQELHAKGRLHVAKIGQAYKDCANERMTSAQYDSAWYDHGQILADGIEDDKHAILLEQAGMDFLTKHNLCLNKHKAALPRIPGQDGYSASRTGAVYYKPLLPRLTRDDYFHPETGNQSYHLQAQGGGKKAQGIDKHSQGID